MTMIHLTKTQIEHWKQVLSIMYPGALFNLIPDHLIEGYVQKVQDQFNKVKVQDPVRTWELKVLLFGSTEKFWEEIEAEPKKISATMATIEKSSKGLLKRHPEIAGLRVCSEDDDKIIWVYTREDFRDEEDD